MSRDPEEPISVSPHQQHHPHSYSRQFNSNELFNFFHLLQSIEIKIKFGFCGSKVYDRLYPCGISQDLEGAEYQIFCRGFIYPRKILDEMADNKWKMDEYKIFQDTQAWVMPALIRGLNKAEPVYFRMFPEISYRRDFLTGNGIASLYWRFYNKGHTVPVLGDNEKMQLVNFGDHT